MCVLRKVVNCVLALGVCFGLVCLVAPSVVAVDAGSAMVQHQYRLIYAGKDGSGRVVVPQAPAGMTYTKFEVIGFDRSGQFSGALLRSDGKMVGFGADGIKAVAAIDQEFPDANIRDFTELNADGAYVILDDGTVRQPTAMKDRDNFGWVEGVGWAEGIVPKGRLAGPWDAPNCAVPSGGFSRFLPGRARKGREMLLLRTDGRVTGFWTVLPTEFDDPFWVERGNCKTTARSGYVGGAISNFTGDDDDALYSNLDFLLRKNGRVDVYDGFLTLVVPKKGTRYDPNPIDDDPVPKLFVPKLPAGTRYVGVAGQDVVAYLRSDGKMIYRTDSKWTVPFKQKPPKLPMGMTYVSLDEWFDSWILMRSDGQAVVLNGGYTTDAGRVSQYVRSPKRQLPKLAKGWRYVSGAIPRDKETIFLVEKIPTGLKVATGIEKVKTPKSVRWGKTAKVTVKVASRAILDGGTVKVTHKGKTIGKAKVKGTKAVIKVKTRTLKLKGRNTVGVQYLGDYQGKKSAKVKVTVTTRV